MPEPLYRLVIGSKRFSSWSLRPWLLLREAGLPFEEVLIALRQPDTAERIRTYSPSGKVPLLQHGSLAIWDSLAIAEYLAERHPEKALWPTDTAARAVARSLSAEMHSGFPEMRRDLSMDFGARKPLATVSEGAARDVARIISSWCDVRSRFGANGPFLFGRFSIADAMYAPVVSRLETYVPELAAHGDDGTARAYCRTIMGLDGMQAWGEGAAAEAKSA